MAEAVLCAACRVGAGLRPRPVFRGRGVSCGGRPMCRPGHVPLRDPFTGGHIGPPLREAGSVPEPTGIGAETDLANGAGRSPPPTGERRRSRRGVVTPPYGCITGGAQQRADVPKAWLPPTKFCAGIWGVSHGHRPLRGEGEVSATTRASGAQRSVCASGWEEGGESEQGSSPKGPSASGNPSVTAFGRDSSLCTREPWGRGMRIAASALRTSSQ